MNPKYLVIIAIVVIVAIFGSSIVGSMNTIPQLDEKVNASWAEVQNQYQRRADLVPNLVETVKGYANFEQKTLTDVISARANATKVTLTPEMLSNPAAVKQFEQAQGGLSSALSRLMVVAERYPDLKANQNFLALQSQLEGTENRITVARKDYIETVQFYNVRVRTFPGIIWAKFYGAKPKQTFAATQGSEKPPAVKF
ncbi:MAG: LemA family protein [Alphaproteobacteria bacterium]|nr:LemA family protein [Alphaproteobacteria bacterium]